MLNIQTFQNLIFAEFAISKPSYTPFLSVGILISKIVDFVPGSYSTALMFFDAEMGRTDSLYSPFTITSRLIVDLEMIEKNYVNYRFFLKSAPPPKSAPPLFFVVFHFSEEIWTEIY